MTLLSILVIEYDEQRQQQIELAEATGLQAVYQSRGGYLSLAKAINEGIKKSDSIYTWIVTNVQYSPEVPGLLLEEMIKGQFAAIHPAFASDHAFCRPRKDKAIIEAPFIEFTAAMVNTAILKENPLDENMPYWGHDLDWGYRMRKQGQRLAVASGIEIQHQYIRYTHDAHKSTILRKRFREETDYQTTHFLTKKYWPDWERILKTKP